MARIDFDLNNVEYSEDDFEEFTPDIEDDNPEMDYPDVEEITDNEFDDPITYTTFNGSVKNKTPDKTITQEWDEFIESFSIPQQGKKDGSYFVRGTCNGERENENISNIGMGVVDADDGIDGKNSPCPPPDFVADKLNSLNYQFGLYTSFSNTPEKPKYRILLKPDREILPEEVKLVYQGILKTLDNVGVRILENSESSTLSQPWYHPRYETEEQRNNFFFASGGIKALPVDQMIQIAKEADAKSNIDADAQSVAGGAYSTCKAFQETFTETLKAGVQPCFSFFANDSNLQATGSRNFNTISMALCSYSISAGLSLEDALKHCHNFIETYKYSNSLKTPKDRENNFKQRFKSMLTREYSFECGYIQGLLHDIEGIDAKRQYFSCKECQTKKAIDDFDKWNFEDAEYWLSQLKTNMKNNPDYCYTADRIILIKDIISKNTFDIVEMDIIQNSIKTLFKINLGTQKKIIEESKKPPDTANSSTPDIEGMTHIQICNDYIENTIKPTVNNVVASEGLFWHYNKNQGIYLSNDPKEIHAKVGDRYSNSKYCKRRGDYTAITQLVYDNLSFNNEDFFEKAEYGLCGNKYFYSIKDKEILPIPHSPELRQRWKLPVEPDFNNPPSKFLQYLEDSFTKNKAQQDLLQEIFGALITGTAHKLQKAFLLYGGGENGKSVMLEILESIFDDKLKCAIRPDTFSNEYYKAALAGKIINIVGEVEKSEPLKSDFKDIVGCDTRITARQPYNPTFNFTPIAGHIFAGNGFPQTRDHSHGFYRRWAIVHYKHKVDPAKKIPELGKVIVKEELPQLLAWGLTGARRLITNNFKLTETKEHAELLLRWKNIQDSVIGFLNDEEWVKISDYSHANKRATYQHYRSWCFWSGAKALGLHNFYDRVSEVFPSTKLSSLGGEHIFKGFEILRQEGNLASVGYDFNR
ncbi:MAG: hypothetical protein HQK63_14250 [Desulfamplus sp.]|nr:hypothetical protein [Desulfamplus sp.]